MQGGALMVYSEDPAQNITTTTRQNTGRSPDGLLGESNPKQYRNHKAECREEHEWFPEYFYG